MDLLGYVLFVTVTIGVPASLVGCYKNNSGLTVKKHAVRLVSACFLLLISAVMIGTPSAYLLFLSVGVILALHLAIIKRPYNNSDAIATKRIKIVMQRIEATFDILYIISGLTVSVVLTNNATYGILPGLMGFLLIIGDSFHLLPRIHLAFGYGKDELNHNLGIGKQVASITMTVFYLLLTAALIGILNQSISSVTFTAVCILAAVRIILCLLPQNRWDEASSAVRFSIIRNIPFVLMGAISFVYCVTFDEISTIFPFLGISILLSFIFYIPVTLWSAKHPMIGMLMLPKSVVYIWMMTMFV